MKKLMTTIAVLAVVATPALAQADPGKTSGRAGLAVSVSGEKRVARAVPHALAVRKQPQC